MATRMCVWKKSIPKAVHDLLQIAMSYWKQTDDASGKTAAAINWVASKSDQETIVLMRYR